MDGGHVGGRGTGGERYGYDEIFLLSALPWKLRISAI